MRQSCYPYDNPKQAAPNRPTDLSALRQKANLYLHHHDGSTGGNVPEEAKKRRSEEAKSANCEPNACHLPPAACRQTPATCRLPPATCRLPPAACHLPPAACHLPPAACRLPPAACRLPPAAQVLCARWICWRSSRRAASRFSLTWKKTASVSSIFEEKRSCSSTSTMRRTFPSSSSTVVP
jgi:hypothetical protein